MAAQPGGRKKEDEKPEPKLPPKLKVPPAAKREKTPAAMTDTTRAMKPPPVPPSAKPPKPEPPRKEETTRIDLGEAEAGPVTKAATARIETPPESEIEGKATTAPIKLPGEGEAEPKAATARIADAEPKGETARIDLAEEAALAEPEVREVPGARGILEGVPADLEEVMKKSTVRIEMPTDQPERVTPEDVAEAAKKATVRVQIDEDVKKGDTEKVNAQAILEAERAEGAKKKTSRIDLGEVLEGGEETDIFKRRTAVLDASKLPVTAAPGAPRTIRIKRPSPPPPTAVMKHPSETDEIAVPAVTPVAEEPEPRKTETSRIELPAEAMERPPTRRKTIRIKRPDGTISSRQLTIARPSDVLPGAEGELAGEEASPVFSILAIAAAAVALILLYVLAAQTIATGLPFPGKLI